MKTLDKLKRLGATALGVCVASAAWSATPLAVWNGDFNTGTTRNGVTFSANDNTVNADGSVTIKEGATTGIAFTLPANYNYIQAVFTVSNVTGTATANGVLVSTKGGGSARGGVYVKSGGLSTGAINGTTAWGTTTYDGELTSYADNANQIRTFAVTQVKNANIANGLHLYEIYGGGTDAKIVYGGDSDNGLNYNVDYNVVTIGGFATAPTEEGAIGTMEGLTVLSVALYGSNSTWPLDSTARANFAMPLSGNVGASVGISALNTALASAGNTFINFTADNVYLTADATPAANIILPYDTTVTLTDGALALSGSLPVKLPSSGVTSVTGSGVVVADDATALATVQGFATSFAANTWTGTVWLKNQQINNLAPITYGNSGSTLRLSGIYGYFGRAAYTAALSPALELEDDSYGYGLRFTDGYSYDSNSGWAYTQFPALKGSGKLITNTQTASKGQLGLIMFQDWSEFTGSMALTNRTVWLGTSAAPASDNSNISVGTIYVESGKTFTVPSNFSSWYMTTGFTGAGTVKTTVANSQYTKAENAKWSGTVEVAADVLSSTASTPVYLKTMGSAAPSTIVLKGLSGSTHWLHSGNAGDGSSGGGNHTISATVQLDGDVTFNNGSSGRTYTFNKLTGSGAFNWLHGENIIVKDVSGYSGTVAYNQTSYAMTLGVPTTPAVGDLIAKVDSTNNKVSTSVYLNGAANVLSGELKTVNDVYGLYATTAATVGEDSYTSVAAAIAATEEGDTVTLSRTAYAETVAITKDISIDLNGNPLNANSFDIASGATLTLINTGNKQVKAPSFTGGGSIVAPNGLRLCPSDATATSSLASITVTGDLSFDSGSTGTFNVSGDVSATGSITVRDVTFNVSGGITATVLNMAASNIDGRNRLNASSGGVPAQTQVTAGTIDAQIYGSGNVTTTSGAVSLGANSDSSLVGAISASNVAVSGSGTTTLYGANTVSGTLTIEAGATVALGNPLTLGTAVRDYDASSSTIVVEDGYVTSVTDLISGTTTCSPVDASVVTVVENDDSVFGGRKVLKTDTTRLRDSAATSTSHDMTTFLVWKKGSATNAYTAPLWDSTSGSGSAAYGISTHNNVKGPYEFRNSNAFGDSSYIFSNGVGGGGLIADEQCLTVCGNWMLNTSGVGYMQFGAKLEGNYIAEVLVYNEDFTRDERAAIEAVLMEKWGFEDVVYTPISTTAEIVLTTGATLDLGGLAQTVKSITGSGTVQNGEITITDALAIPTGCTLVLPVGSTYTLANAATVDVATDTDAGTITLTHKAATISVTDPDTQEVTTTVYASVEEALADYTEGTLTICEDTTLALAEEVSVGSVVVADGVNLTITQAPPFTTTFENGALTCTRVASTFVYTGASDYSATSGNFTIGGVATPAIPGTADTVQFETATSIYIGSENIQYAAFILNADVTVTGAGTNYLRVNGYTGTGKLILGGYGYLAPTTACTIACPLEVTGENPNRLHIADNSSYYTTVTGKMTGTGTLQLTKWMNEGYSGHHFDCDGSEFYGTINEVQPNSANASRNATYFEDTDFSNAKVNLTWAGKDDGALRFKFSSESKVIKFGSLNGHFVSTASGSLTGHATIEVGNLNLDDTIEGNWLNNDSSRSPYLRKVGTGTLTTYVTDTYGYILNGGTLVVMAAAAQKDVTTELAGYEVVATPTCDTEGDDPTAVLYTTYTLRKLVAEIEGGDKYATLAAAVEAATDGDTVTLLADVTLDARVDVNVGAGTTITIDLGENTITTSATCLNGSAFNIQSGTVTITNGSVIGVEGPSGGEAYECDVITVRSGAEVVVSAMTITIDSRNGACVYPFTGAKATILSGTYANTTEEAYQYKAAWTGMAVNQGNVAQQLLFIEGGTFSKVNPELGDDSGMMTNFCQTGYISVDNGDGTFTVKQGAWVAEVGTAKFETVTAALAAATEGQTVTVLADYTNAGGEAAVFAKAYAVTLDLNGCTITGTDGVRLNAAGPLTITDSSASGLGKVVATASDGVALWARNGSAVVTAGSFQNNSVEEATVYVGFGDATQYDGQSVTISGGSFVNLADYKWGTSDYDYCSLNVVNKDFFPVTAISVSGGTFSYDPAKGDDNKGGTFVASGYKSTETSTGVWTVSLAPSGIDPASTENTPLDVASSATQEEAQAAADALNVIVTSAVDAALTTASVAPATYQGYFTKTAVKNETTGAWEVQTTIAEAVAVAADTSALTALQAAVADSTKTTFSVEVPAGLYYKIETFDTLGGTVVGTQTGLSTGTTNEVTKPTTAAQGFVKVTVSSAALQ